ncbi:transmembrane protein 233 [Chelmon rostratus]|uniref:transmembrane protein 233 n=1 Tax=Chelmon rostratus TaxID=109905 RepID=UPI001BE78F9C|nr:transmembrane protein 233 [Chelmon rostratus]
MNTKPSLDGNREAREIPPLRNYLCLTMFTCFCPAWPVNIVALVFSVLAQKSYDEEDYDGSERLGRKALHLGIVSSVIGLLIITAYAVVHFTTVRMHQIYEAKMNRRMERCQVSFSSTACGVSS